MKPLVTLTLLMLVASPAASEHHFIVRAESGSEGIGEVCRNLGLEVVGSLDVAPNKTFLVRSSDYLPSETILEWLAGAEGVVEAEPVLSALIGEPVPDAGLDMSTVALLNGLTDSQVVDYFGSAVWQGYVNQPSGEAIDLGKAQSDYNVSGSGIVAVIDTGVDPDHPALQGVLVPGYDFTRELPGIPSELADLDLSTVALLNQSTVALLDQSTVALLGQSTVALLNQLLEALSDPSYAAFGHGTMVAGLVHLVAPQAQIMPLKAFRADGTAATSDIVRAIYYAVEHGARVINMSLSLSQFSPALLRAINFATRQGVVCVASVGNESESTLVYPASYGNVIGVASTTNLGGRASFSNFGRDSVRLSAPGEGIITTYPGGTYAAVWGTSFSAAMVSGAVATLFHAGEMLKQELNILPSADHYSALPHVKLRFVSPVITEALSRAESLLDEGLGYGMLDVEKAVKNLRKHLKGLNRP